MVVLKEDQLPQVEAKEDEEVETQIAAKKLVSSEAEVVKVVKADDGAVEKSQRDAPTLFDKKIKRLGMNPVLNFAGFVVGENSQFAHAACQAIAEGRPAGIIRSFFTGDRDLARPTS